MVQVHVSFPADTKVVVGDTLSAIEVTGPESDDGEEVQVHVSHPQTLRGDTPSLKMPSTLYTHLGTVIQCYRGIQNINLNVNLNSLFPSLSPSLSASVRDKYIKLAPFGPLG